MAVEAEGWSGPWAIMGPTNILGMIRATFREWQVLRLAPRRAIMLSDQDHDHRQPETDEAEFEGEEMYLSDALGLLGGRQESDGPGEPVDIQGVLPVVLSVIDELDEECEVFS
jgi:hypothetical protein